MSTRMHVGFDKVPLLASAWPPRPFRGGGWLAQKPEESEGPFLWDGEVVMGTRQEGARPCHGNAGKIVYILLKV
jgi:hypothetical protein